MSSTAVLRTSHLFLHSRNKRIFSKLQNGKILCFKLNIILQYDFMKHYRKYPRLFSKGNSPTLTRLALRSLNFHTSFIGTTPGWSSKSLIHDKKKHSEYYGKKLIHFHLGVWLEPPSLIFQCSTRFKRLQ